MFNFIYNRPRSIKHIENELFGALDFMMIGDFYEASLMKDNWIFQNVKDNVNALAPNFLANICPMLWT